MITKSNPHSCKLCKYCRTRTTKGHLTYYLCDYDKNQIKGSIYITNDCLTFISKK